MSSASFDAAAGAGFVLSAAAYNLVRIRKILAVAG
jgi:hypothetical protein